MPTYVLEGGAHALLAAQPLTIRIRGGAVAVRARRLNGSEATGVITPGSGILVIPSLTEPVVVRVEPADAGQFPPGSVLDVSVSPESRREADPDQATMSGVDVSGLSGRDLLRMEPQDGRIRVTALGIRVDAPLPPVAEAVRDAARSLLHMEALPEERTVAVQLLVDASASTRSLVDSDELTTAVEVMVGLTRVISGDRELTAAVGATQLRPVPATEPTALPAAVSEALRAAPLRAGFRPVAPTGVDQVQVVISDAPALTEPPAGVRRHTLVVAPRSTWPAFAGRRHATTLLPVAETLGAGAGGPRLAEQMLGDDRLVADITRSLLDGLLPQNVEERR